MRRVLVVNDDDSARQTLQLSLRSAGYEAFGVASVDAARRAIEADRFQAVLVSWALVPAGARPFESGDLGAALIALVPADAGTLAGLAAMASGAHDFVVDDGTGTGADSDVAGAVVLALKKAEARAAQPPPVGRSTGGVGDVAPAGASGTTAPGEAGAGAGAGATLGAAPASAMVGQSPSMIALAAAIRKVAPFKATVFIHGESGTGKELIARALHRQSPRAGGPFVAVNCGAIPAGLIESELLGHSKGAFTDALRDRAGLMEQASGGTLFLDEIAELPLALQVKLLRVLQEDRVRRLGDSEERPVDVRLVAATARDLEAEVAAGRFREDLFHRINVVGLRVPPLRARAQDIPLLVAHFVAGANARLGLALRGVSSEAMRALVDFAWPGNVRELENTVERAAVMCDGAEIDVASLPERLLRGKNGSPSPSPSPSSSPADPGDLSIKRAARRTEEDLIRRALTQTGGNRTRAAELLEISHRALLYKIKEYGVVLPMPSPGAKDAKL